jgi:tRNA-dihydrouridine synthase
VLRNPWILAQAADLAAGRTMRQVSDEERGRFLLDYMDLLLHEGEDEEQGFRHGAIPGSQPAAATRDQESTRRHQRWVINKMRALMSWYSKGLHNGGHLRIGINGAASISETRDLIEQFFSVPASAPASVSAAIPNV